MKNKERGTLEELKLFLEPVKLRPLIYLKYLFLSIIWGINGIIHILFLERITFYLQEGDNIGFGNILKYYMLFIIIYEIINFSIRKWGWVETLPLGMSDMYKKYLEKYIILDNNKIETIGTGKLVGIFKSGVEKWLSLLADFLEKGIGLIITFIVAIYMVAKVDSFYAFIFLFLFLIFLTISIYFNGKLIPYRKKRYEYRNSRLKYIVKILMNKQEIMQTAKISKETDVIHYYSKKLRLVNREMGTFRSFMHRAPQLGMTLILLGTFWYLGNEVIEGNILINVVVGLSGVLIIMQKTIIEFVGFYIQVTKDIVDVQKLWDFFDNTPEMKGYNTGEEFKYKNGKIEIENLTYGYSKNKPIFKDFSLKLNGGKVTALVGNSGSGKSTLVKLIAGYISGDSGKIIVDEQEISKISLKSYYKNIGYLTQEPSVFDGTILDNLMYGAHAQPLPSKEGSRDVWKKHLEKIIKLAKCEFIYDLENGLETEIGERGVRLSGGQKQRLAIAKIFLKDPKIIILDEPTSALDSFSEEQITKAMHNLFKGRTVIVIAHRLQTVKEASDIILFENGEIKERGTHEKLVKLNGQYKKMLDLQSGF